MFNAHFILFTADQERATRFYREVLGRSPRLNVPGMTEFELGAGAVLGLMPEVGIERLLQQKIRPSSSKVPRGELYLLVDDLETHWERALGAEATVLQEPVMRDWGDVAGYVLDLDGHVLALAQRDEARPQIW